MLLTTALATKCKVSFLPVHGILPYKKVGDNFIGTLRTLNFGLPPPGALNQMGGFKFATLLSRGQRTKFVKVFLLIPS